MSQHIAVVIPCFKVRGSILAVLADIGDEVASIYVVDDKCPYETGRYVQQQCDDLRVHVLFHDVNKGVGGAVATGYRQALNDGADVVVKVDGDGQMDPNLIPLFCKPILSGEADYTKGNRFFEVDSLKGMPILRLIGNAGLSFLNKLISGFWKVMDPTNGFTAIHAAVLSHIPLEKLDERYFFESDMLFRLGVLRAKVVDIPMDSKYGSEVSSLSIKKVLLEFPPKYLNRLFKRIGYNYFMRDFNVASIELALSLIFLAFGVWIGLSAWWESIETGVTASSGTVMLSALPTFIGVQLFLSFLNYDIRNQPSHAIFPLLVEVKKNDGAVPDN